MIKEQIQKDLKDEVADLKEEIQIAKSILKEPKLCNIVMKKFNTTVE